jgi:hypothetical protein
MDETIIPDKPEETPKETAPGAGEEAPSPDPVKMELEKVQKEGKSKREKLIFTKNRIDQQLKELNEEEGVVAPLEGDDDRPLTIGEFKKIQRQQSVQTAEELVDEEASLTEAEKELMKHHLSNTIRPSGSARQDYNSALMIVSGVKNRQILEEQGRKATANNHSSGAGNPPKEISKTPDLTVEERAFLGGPWNLTPEQIVKARPK